MKAILTYHSVDGSSSPISIGEAAFRNHAEWLARHGPPVVTPAELLLLPPSEPAVALTFDDAFRSFADVAWPILRNHGLPATVFVPTAHVGGTNTWGGVNTRGIPTLPLLDWDQLGRLAEEGVQIGSHTCTHPHLTSLSPARQHEELGESAAQLQARLGIRPAGLAYPYGAWNPQVTAAAALLYDYAVTVDLRPLAPDEDPLRLPRLDAYYLRDNRLLEAWGTTRLRLYLNARAGVRRWRAALVTGHHA